MQSNPVHLVIIDLAKCFVDHDNDINRLLYATVTNEIEMRKRPEFNIWESRAFSLADLSRIDLSIRLAFDNPGEAL